MAIIRIAKKQIEEAQKAHEAALLEDPEFRLEEEEQRQRLEVAASAARASVAGVKMGCLEATFTLTPRSPVYFGAPQQRTAHLSCCGVDFLLSNPYDLESQHTSNRFFFSSEYASDPNLDYARRSDRKKARLLTLLFDLRSYSPANKQLVLIFGFDLASASARVLVYTDAGRLHDQTLVYGDNQFLLEVDSIDQPQYLYFIHAGGNWFFRGLSGYVV